MDGMRFVVPLHGHGTLSADMIMHYKLPCGATLVQVDAVATTAAVGTVKIGTDADDDGYLQGVHVRGERTCRRWRIGAISMASAEH